MTVREFRESGIEIQTEARYVWYDYDRDIREDVVIFDVIDLEIRYMYVEDGVLYIEVEKPEFDDE